MKKNEVVLVAVDPIRQYHPALERVIISARLSETKPSLHLFIAVDTSSNYQDSSSINMYSSLQSINDLVASVEAEGLTCQTELYWGGDWQQGMLDTAKHIKADLIVMTNHSVIERNIFLSDSKWMLLRRAKRPVMLVRAAASDQRQVVLAAVNIQAEDDAYQALNARIIDSGRRMVAQYNAELHVVNAYPDSMNYPDRGKLIMLTQCDSANVHIKAGPPEQVVAEVAKDISADVVVMGTLARKGLIENIRGNTSERVLNSLALHDVLTIN